MGGCGVGGMCLDEAEAAVQGLTGAGLEQVRGLLRAAGGDPEAAAQLWLAQQEGGEGGEARGPVPPAPAARHAPARPTSVRGGVATLASLRDAEGDGSPGADGKGPNDYFAGSGQLVRGRPDGDGSQRGQGAVSGLFDAARAMGAREGSYDDLPGHGGAPAPFSGRGHTLNSQGEVPAQGGARASDPPQRHLVEFWENGVFSVNKGPPRRVLDPANLEFMQAISRGECPPELEGADGQGVEVSLMRHHGEYEEPEAPKYVAFSGQGRTLAGDDADCEANDQVDAGEGSAPPREELVVDEALPVTSIQMRLSDGTRMVARFNLSHTVADLRAFIDRSRPGGARTYKLATADFPPKTLADPAATIEEAGLANAVVIQRG